jgi:hypothetical protein
VFLKNSYEILQQICENLKGWSKNFQEMPFLGQFFFFGVGAGGQGLGFFQEGVGIG